MHQFINNKLAEIENQHQVKILFACESGSRAWGFASPDSDYDIRFIYQNNLDHYLSIWQKTGVIEFQTAENLDGSGWDLAKALQLISKSNVAILEWINAPIIYQANEIFYTKIRPIANSCFSPIASLHHYLGTTKNFMEICEAENVKLKSYFYALRTVLAGKWIIEQNSFPPVLFTDLLPIAPKEITEKVIEMMDIKSIKDESYLHPKEVLITNFIKKTIEYNQEKASGLKTGNKNTTELDDFFREMITTII